MGNHIYLYLCINMGLCHYLKDTAAFHHHVPCAVAVYGPIFSLLKYVYFSERQSSADRGSGEESVESS